MSKSGYLLRIDLPCSSDWTTMTPQEGGRFCEQCSKTVHDFTGLTNAQIISILDKNKNGVCGRLYDGQLNRELFRQPAPTQATRTWLKLLAGAFFLGSSTPALAQQSGRLPLSPPVAQAGSDTSSSVSNSIRVAVIDGKIVDGLSGRPMAGLLVRLKTAPKALAFTNDDGTFRIRVPDSLQRELPVVEALGWNDESEVFHYVPNDLGQCPTWRFYAQSSTGTQVVTQTVIAGAIVSVRITRAHWWQFWKRRS